MICNKVYVVHVFNKRKFISVCCYFLLFLSVASYCCTDLYHFGSWRCCVVMSVCLVITKKFCFEFYTKNFLFWLTAVSRKYVENDKNDVFSKSISFIHHISNDVTNHFIASCMNCKTYVKIVYVNVLMRTSVNYIAILRIIMCTLLLVNNSKQFETL